MDIKQKILENKYIILILLLTFSIRLLAALRSPVLAGLDVFYHYDIVELFLAGHFSISDVFSISRISAGGYPLLFQWISSLFVSLGISTTTFFKIFPAFLSVAVVCFFYMFCREITTKKISILASFFISTAPIVVLRTSQAMPELLALVFLFAALLLLVRLHKSFNLLSLLMLGLVTVLYFFTHRSILFLFILLLISLLTLFREQLRHKLVLSLILLGVVGGLYFKLFGLLFEQLKRIPWEAVTAKGYLLSTGIMLIPALVGIVVAYHRRNETDIFLIGWVSVFAGLGMMSFRFRDPFLMFPLAILAAYGIYEYIKPNSKTYFKKILAIVIVFAVLQAFVVSAYMIPKPSSQEYEALSWISDNTPEDSTILSWSDEGYWVVGIADRKDVVLWNRLYKGLYDDPPPVAETEKTYKDVIKIFRTFNLTTSKELIKKYNVSHVYVSRKMLEDRDALQFGLLEYINTSRDFEKLYQAGNNSVYKVNFDET